jgi:hypothetical protein
MSNFIKGFRRIVDERGTTFAHISKVSGVSRGTVVNVYHGMVNDVQLDTAHKLSNALGLTLAEVEAYVK